MKELSQKETLWMEKVDGAILGVGLLGLAFQFKETQTIDLACLGLVWSFLYRRIISGTMGTLTNGPDYINEVEQMETEAGFDRPVKEFAYGLRMIGHDVLWVAVACLGGALLD